MVVANAPLLRKLETKISGPRLSSQIFARKRNDKAHIPRLLFLDKHANCVTVRTLMTEIPSCASHALYLMIGKPQAAYK